MINNFKSYVPEYQKLKRHRFKKRIKKNINITSLFILLILLLGVYFNTSLSFSENSSEETEIHRTEQYLVRSGDTLWEIAMKYKQTQEDPREYIDRLMAMNDMSNAMIYAGQTITVYINESPVLR